VVTGFANIWGVAALPAVTNCCTNYFLLLDVWLFVERNISHLWAGRREDGVSSSVKGLNTAQYLA